MLDEIIACIVKLIADVWSADSEIRDGSLLGESEGDSRSRKFVAWVCGGSIVLASSTISVE